MGHNITSQKQKLFAIVKWILAISFFLAAIGLVTDKAFLAALCFFICSLLLLPLLSLFWKTKFPFLHNINAKAGIVVVLLVIGGVSLSSGTKASKEPIKEDKAVAGSEISLYQEYYAKSEKVIAQFNAEQRASREKLYSALKANPVYKKLVDSSMVSIEYMPLLSAIASGIGSISPDGFSMDEDVMRSIEKSPNSSEKVDFVIKTTALATPANGGLTKEIIEVFERYKDKYNLYGEKGLQVDGNGKRTSVEHNYDLSPFFGFIAPANTTFLNAIYEAKRKGLSKWPNSKAPISPYLNTKEGYMAYIKLVYPQSPYILKVDAELTAMELYRAYDANEVSADEQFKGKRLAITGVVGDIIKDFTGDAKVSLEVGILQTIDCNFGENTKVISKLRKGDKITVIGTCKGFIVKQVVVDNCEVWE